MINDAFRFILPLLAVAAALAVFHLAFASLLLIILSAFVCYFFRNPRRTVPAGEKLVVSPADGRVVKVSQLSGAESGEAGHQISIFLSVFDVHVNRSPIEGEVVYLEYKRGKFKAAYKEEASQLNEQNVITIRGQAIQVVVRQVAGWIARRVVCWKQPGSMLKRGELFGLIRFGSRVDIVLPPNVSILVRVGDRVRGGSTVLGEYS
jgi:phosphatidylserine decarboxylase